MNRIRRILGELRINTRGWRAERRLRAEAVTDLIGRISELQQRVAELETDIDEVRADSRRIAEIRIQVEDLLGDRA